MKGELGGQGRPFLRPLAKRRRRQLAETDDDENEFRFVTVRDQARYRQRNYQKISYVVSVPDKELIVDLDWLKGRRGALASIGFEATLRKYHANSQRSLMTPELRRQIAERDNYTCQIQRQVHARRRGPAHRPHRPRVEGRQDRPPNLQVLCSKYNGSKGDKLR